MPKAVRIGIIVVVVGILLTVVILSSSTKTAIADQVWNTQTTVGDAETATNYYVVYTDIICPYCAVLGQTLTQNQEEFEKWVADNKVLFEVRVTDYLYEGMGSKNSRLGAEATYCATRGGKFWDFYHAAMNQMYKDYQSKGIGVSKASEQVPELKEDYFLKIGKSVGLKDEFEKCVKGHESVDEIVENTAKAAKVSEGVPYMVYNGKAGGIDATDGWKGVKMYLEAGLKK